MQFDVKAELRTFITYFLFALTAEIGGFFGWINEMAKAGDMFQVSSAFWVHEVTRLRVWLPVFLVLSIGRLLILVLARRLETKSVKELRR